MHGFKITWKTGNHWIYQRQVNLVPFCTGRCESVSYERKDQRDFFPPNLNNWFYLVLTHYTRENYYNIIWKVFFCRTNKK